MVPLDRGPPPKRSQTPHISAWPHCVPYAPVSAQPVNQVFSRGPPASRAPPLPVGPVVDSVADQLRALELLSSFMDPPEVEALRSRLVPTPVPVPSEPALTSHQALAQELADKCKRHEMLQTLLSEQRVKVAEEESVCLSVCKLIWLGSLGKHQIWMKRFLSCGGRFVIPEPEDRMPVMGQPPDLLCVKDLKRELRRGKSQDLNI